MGNEVENGIYRFLYSDDSVNGLLIDSDIRHKKRVYRTINTDKIKKAVMPDEIRDFSLSNNQKFMEYNEYLSNFVNKLLQTYPKDYLGNLYRNIRTLKIKKKKSVLLSLFSFYHRYKNEIKLVDNDAIYHELMHMASNSLGSDNFGFQIHDVGVGLNEGYTELLAARLFYNGKITCYYFQCEVAKILEKVIGPKMTELYFKADLLGLIKELNKYSAKEEITDFIYNMDILFRINRSIFSGGKCTLEVAYYVINIYNYLTKIYMLKLKEDLKNHKITEEEYYQIQDEFINNIRNYYINHFGCDIDSWYNTTTYKIFSEFSR